MKTQTSSRLLLAGASLATLARRAGCRRQQGTQQMMADIRMLQEQSQQLQNLIGALDRGAEGGQHAARRAGRRQPQGVRRSEAGDRQPARTTCASSARSWTTTTCASARSPRKSSAATVAAADRHASVRRPATPAIRRRPARRPARRAAPPRRRRLAAGGDRRVAAEAVRLGDGRLLLPASTISRSSASSATSRRFPKSDLADDAQVNIGNVVPAGRQERQGGRGLRPRRSAPTRTATRFPTRTTRRDSRCRT